MSQVVGLVAENIFGIMVGFAGTLISAISSQKYLSMYNL